jgi:hypothetical protein
VNVPFARDFLNISAEGVQNVPYAHSFHYMADNLFDYYIAETEIIQHWIKKIKVNDVQTMKWKMVVVGLGRLR